MAAARPWRLPLHAASPRRDAPDPWQGPAVCTAYKGKGMRIHRSRVGATKGKLHRGKESVGWSRGFRHPSGERFRRPCDPDFSRSCSDPSSHDGAARAPSEVDLDHGNTVGIRGSRPGSEGASANVMESEEAEKKCPTVSVSSERRESGSASSLTERNHVRRLVEFIAAWDEMVPHLPARALQSISARRLLSALKLVIPLLLDSPPLEDGRKPVSRAIAVATVLANLGMEVDVIIAGLLREAVSLKACTLDSVVEHAGQEVAQLIKESLRVRKSFQRNKSFSMSMDDVSSKRFRNYCLSFYSPKAILIELAARMDSMRNLSSFPRWQQQYQALETLQIWSPLSYVLGAGSMLWELEDISFNVLFSKAYQSLASWLNDQSQDANDMLEFSKLSLQQRLMEDRAFTELVESVSISGRFKSIRSTIKKLLKDGRSREEVFDLVGLRLVIHPNKETTPSSMSQSEVEAMACYRARHIITSLWKEVEGRSKDYISNPKPNGYQSLHLAVTVFHNLPPLEIQIRTVDMHTHAVQGNASHDAYKSGLTDPNQVRELKAIMVAVSAMTASSGITLDHSASKSNLVSGNIEIDHQDVMFQMFDRNGDGSISIEEIEAVMVELGSLEEDVPSKGAQELVQMIASDESKHITPKEFSDFRKMARNGDRSSSNLLSSSTPKVKGLLPPPDSAGSTD